MCPGDVEERVQALAALRREAATNPPVAAFREQITSTCEPTARALRTDDT